MLSRTIRKDNSVLTICRATVTGFVATEVNSSIFVIYSIFILVFRLDISIRWLVVRWGILGSMVRRGEFVWWGWLVDWSGLDCWSWVVEWGRFIGWSWPTWGMGNSMTVSSGTSMFNCIMSVNISIGGGQGGKKSNKGL
jgi:hypothetical protein